MRGKEKKILGGNWDAELLNCLQSTTKLSGFQSFRIQPVWILYCSNTVEVLREAGKVSVLVLHVC